jgi:hypothetical protein
MVMAPCATFKYFVIVPKDPHNHDSPWPVRMDEPVPPFGDSLFTSRLVGYSPHLYRSNAGTVSPHKLDTPVTHTTRLTLVAQDKKNASVSESSFLIASSLFSSLQQGDLFHMAGTDCGGTGFSVIRDGRLVFAAGAVHAVPLGEDIRVNFPNMSESGQRYMLGPLNCDPELRQQPIEVRVGTQAFTAYEGRSQLGGYKLSVVHAFRLGIPGDDECVAMIRTEAGSLEEVEMSARLLDRLELKKLSS